MTVGKIFCRKLTSVNFYLIILGQALSLSQAVNISLHVLALMKYEVPLEHVAVKTVGPRRRERSENGSFQRCTLGMQFEKQFHVEGSEVSKREMLIIASGNSSCTHMAAIYTHGVALLKHCLVWL